MFNKNIGKLDRIIRFVMGTAVMLSGIFGSYDNSKIKIILIIMGSVVIFTSITGFCGLYKLLGICTIKKDN